MGRKVSQRKRSRKEGKVGRLSLTEEWSGDVWITLERVETTYS